MFKLKKNNEEKESRPAKAAKVGVPVAQYFNTLILPVLFVFTLCGAALFYLQNQTGQQVVAAPKDVAVAVTKGLSKTVGIYTNALAGYLAEHDVGPLLLSEDQDRLRIHEGRIKQLLPEIRRVRFLPLEWNQKDQHDDPPLSFASFDLLRNVEKSGNASKAEIHQLGTGNVHVALAMPVAAPGDELAGVLHVALPFELVSKSLPRLTKDGGSLELRQLEAGKVTFVAGANHKNAEMAGSVAVAGTIWELAYGAPVIEVDYLTKLLPMGVLLVGALLVLVLVSMQAKRLKKDLSSDSSAALAILEEVKSGAGARPPAARVAEIQQLLELVRRIASTAGVAKSSTKAPQAKTASTSDDSGVASSASVSELEREPVAAPIQLDRSIFRAYDIRGVVGQSLTEAVVHQIGQAIGSEAYDQGQQSVIIARDGRQSGPALSSALAAGLMASGRDVIDIGMVPTPVLYFATHFLGANTGVMLTGSHNPADYNGLKIVMAGEALSGEDIEALADRIEEGNLLQGAGSKSEQDLLPDYINRIVGDVQLGRPLKVVVDCGNGVAGIVVPVLLQALGCEVIGLYCDVDGTFPNHHPDPGKPENLEDLIGAVALHSADVGLAFDGDGDRLGVVDGNGKIIWPDRLLMLLAEDVLSRQPGADIIYDVKSTRYLASEILSYGGRPIMWKTGHSLIKAKMKETGALLAGEMSGHIFFKERWFGFDDGVYSAVRLLEVLSLAMEEPAELFAKLPECEGTPEITLWFEREGANVELMDKVMSLGDMEGAKLTTIDGLRADFSDGWGLVRPSNTTPALVFRFEADTPEALERIQAQFRDRLTQADPEITPPF